MMTIDNGTVSDINMILMNTCETELNRASKIADILKGYTDESIPVYMYLALKRYCTEQALAISDARSAFLVMEFVNKQFGRGYL